MIWTTAKNAIVAWVVAGTGLTGKVGWGDQEPGRPSGVYVSLRITRARTIGQDATYRKVVPGTPTPGQEIEQIVRGTRELTVQAQCYGGNDASLNQGDLSPFSRLSGVVLAANLPSRRAAFKAAGLGFLSANDVQSLDGLLGDSYEPRAVVDARFSFVASLSEFNTFIESVELSRTISDGIHSESATQELPP